MMIRSMIWLLVTTGFAADTTICLSILVKNNEQNIAACLESVKDFADCICVCDMGSTDETMNIVKRFLLETKIPSFIQQFNEKSFSEILKLEIAQKGIEKYQFSLPDTYVFLIEPNMVLKIDPEFRKNDLKGNAAYLLRQKTSRFSSYYTHLFRADLLMNPSVDYPYWVSNFSKKSIKCNLLILEKKQDEIDLLNEELETKRNNPRYLFDLAKAYHEIENYEMAIKFYQESIKERTDREKCWFSKYMIGCCWEALDNWDEALYWYLDAYEEIPDRADPLLKVATHYRLLGQNDLSYIFAKFGSSISPSQDQIHFTSTPLESYQFFEELSIVSYYTPFKEDGYKAVSDLVLKRGVPYSIRSQAYQNLFFYLEPLQGATYYPVKIDLPFIQEGIRYNPMNPSIVKNQNGYGVICRAVNYTQSGAKNYHTYDDQGVYRSRNFFVQYDRDFNFLWQKEILDESLTEKFGFPCVQGLEDCRIFSWNESLWFTCTTTNTNPTGSFQISLCELGNIDGEPLDFQDYVPVDCLIPLKGPNPYRCEKNWLPFIEKGALQMIYQYDPFIIYTPNLATGECSSVHSYVPTHDFSNFRGSAGPVAFDGGYLILIHEVIPLPNSERVYTHRFVFLDENWIITQASKPFIFHHSGVEFCCGMSLDYAGTKMILPIGIEDREAFICVLDCETIRSMLTLLPAIGL